ncbi:hypothetical protein ACFPVX_13180 [Cohnella faecalis]|uniref:hypothetical protein n=1 Tax=Cohnella faecalis TaxID=2315694 RepID=UPI003606D4FA
MSRLQREWEIKLSLLGSIARSQEALAKILNSVADVTAGLGETDRSPDVLKEHVRVLTGMQNALLRSVTGMSWRPPKKGIAGAPWLAGELRRVAIKKEQRGLEVPRIEKQGQEQEHGQGQEQGQEQGQGQSANGSPG